MGKLLIKTLEEAPATSFPDLAGVGASGATETRAMVQGDDRPLLLWRHALAPGAQLRWRAPAKDHLVYVWEGAADVAGERVEAGDAFIVEHAAAAVLSAAAGPVTLLHFLAPATATRGAGGRVHVIRKASLSQHFHPQTTITVYADSSLADCALWLHSGETPPGMTRFQEQPHSHSQDEIIVVVGGSLLVGPNRYGRGAALAVDADTVYSFAVKEDALHFINFRAGPSWLSLVEKGGGRTAPQSEREFITSLPTEPVV